MCSNMTLKVLCAAERLATDWTDMAIRRLCDSVRGRRVFCGSHPIPSGVVAKDVVGLRRRFGQGMPHPAIGKRDNDLRLPGAPLYESRALRPVTTTPQTRT